MSEDMEPRIQALRAMLDCPKQWIQNERIDAIVYWAERGRLRDHVFRNGYLTLWWYPYVTTGSPQATGWYTTEELRARGIVGVYGYRKVA